MSQNDNNKRDIRAEELIRNYLSGKLTGQEQDELWALMVEHPDYFEHLKLNQGLQKLSAAGELENIRSESGDEESTDDESNIRQLFSNNYTAWVIAAAAVLALVIGLNVLRVSSPDSARDMFALSPDDSPLIGSIDLLYYESIEAYRDELSEDPFVRQFDESLLAAFSGEYDEALRIYTDLIRTYPEHERIHMAYLNSGIIHYNREEFEQASGYFENALGYAAEDADFQEKTNWFLANSKLRLGELEEALENLYVVVQYEGTFMQEAHQLIRTIEPYVVPGAIP